MATDITREEMAARFAASDARLEAAEARTEARFAKIETHLEHMLQGFKSVEDEFHTVHAEIKSTRTTIVVTGLTSALAVFGIIVSILYALHQDTVAAQANMLSAFQAGLAATQAQKQ